MFILKALAVVALAQTSAFSIRSGPLDASNSEFPFPQVGEPQAAASPGVISVQQLERPLEGKGLKLLLKAQSLLARGDSVRGMEQLRAALLEQGAQPYALGLMGTLHLQGGDVTAAITELRESVALLPGHAANRSNLAYALMIRGLNEEAVGEARKALQLDGGKAKTRYVLGQILLHLGEKKEAAFHLKKAAGEIEGARALLAKHFGE